ncbi:MAG: helix-turn-helix domain-containing protein [Silvibacterium sp.]
MNTTPTVSFQLPTNPFITSGQAAILTPAGAADFLGLDVKTVTRWARKGYLPAHPLGEGKRKFWRFSVQELTVWLAAKTNQKEAA